MSKFIVLVMAAGSGTRMDSKVPKQYIDVAGKPLLRRTLDSVLSWPGLVQVRVVISTEHKEFYDTAVQGLEGSDLLGDAVFGSSERHLSVECGLRALVDVGVSPDVPVLIHDAARPFVSWGAVSNLLSCIKPGYGGTLAARVSDTLFDASSYAMIDRDNKWAIQTPQGFCLSDIYTAHQSRDKGAVYTDDASIALAADIDVSIVESGRENFKVTTQDDLTVVQQLIEGRNMTVRTGIGFDVHAFEDTASNRRLVLCGVNVDHDVALLGHSDADVGLHAITDALLGAIGQGDIGQHFPPSDDAFKNMDSAIFLERAVSMMKDDFGTLVNIDVTLICEAPKIGPYATRMKERVAEICAIREDQVNVKATTTERLGFTGRGEGIAAQAVVSVRMSGHV